MICLRACLFVLLVAASLLLATSCFSTREPNPPAAASDWTPPNQPDILIANFSTAVTTLNVVNYERCFSKASYSFYPDPTVARNNQGIFAAWGLQTSEVEYIRNLARLKDNAGGNRLAFASPRTNNLSADSLEYIADYELTLYQADTAYRNYNFKGTINLYLIRNAYNEWAIAAWRDTRTTPTLCWSQLKEKFVGR